MHYSCGMPLTSQELAARRRLEDTLLGLRQEHEWLEHQERMNRLKVKANLSAARAVGITLREISELSGVSRQTLHAWMSMQPIPEVHLGHAGPRPDNLIEAVLRTMGENPMRDWQPAEVTAAIPAAWPSGNENDIAEAMETLARDRRIWDGDQAGYRIAPPPQQSS